MRQEEINRLLPSQSCLQTPKPAFFFDSCPHRRHRLTAGRTKLTCDNSRAGKRSHALKNQCPDEYEWIHSAIMRVHAYTVKL